MYYLVVCYQSVQLKAHSPSNSTQEDYDTERIAKNWKDQINTALSSTQVVDRFFLKETRNIEDTLDYLSGLHRTIVELHSVGHICYVNQALLTILHRTSRYTLYHRI